MKPALSLEEAQTRILAMAEPLTGETTATADASGRYLAQDLIAIRSQPARNLSAMDGFAVGAGGGPWSIIGESRAGHPFPGELGGAEAVRISTGAVVPAGASAILIKENAQVSGESVAGEAPDAGRHIRRAGFDFGAGDTVLTAGTLVGPAQVALALMAGHAALPVRRKPRVAILDSGDELSADPSTCADHQIPASNGAMLAAMIAPLAGEVVRIGPVSDDMEALSAALAQTEGADILVTSGGVSVGDHDLLRPALERWGADLDFWRVAVKPGKPLMVARRGDQAIFGLPGNPVSSFVTCWAFVLPFLRALGGAGDALPRPAMMRCAADLPPCGDRREFLRAVHNGAEVEPLNSSDSSALLELAGANALIERPPGSGEIKAGTSVPVYHIRNG